MAKADNNWHPPNYYATTDDLFYLNQQGNVNAGKIGATSFLPGAKPIEVFTALPTAGTIGRVVLLATDLKLYRDTGSAWTTEVATADLADGAVTNVKLNDSAVIRTNYESFIGQTLLIEAFEASDVLDYWIAYTAGTLPGTPTIVAGNGITGGKVLHAVGGVGRALDTVLIPYNPSWLYKLSVKVRRTVTTDAANQKFYLGFRCLDAAKASITGTRYPTPMSAIDMAGWTINEWQDITAWMKGTSASPSGGTNPTDPYEAQLLTAYFSPVVILNYGNGAGTNEGEVDCIKIEMFDEDAQVRIYTAIDSTGKVNVSAQNIATQGWVLTSAFSVTDADTVAWGAGTLTTAAGTAYSIDAGNTGNMAAKTYIYLDIAVSTTVLQTTTTATTSIGSGKILVAVAQNGTGEATFTVLQAGGKNINAAEIVAGSITANEIATGTITADRMSVSTLSAIAADLGTCTAGTLIGGTVKTASSGQRIEIDPTNGLRLYSSGGAVLSQFDDDIYTSSIKSFLSRGYGADECKIYLDYNIITEHGYIRFYNDGSNTAEIDYQGILFLKLATSAIYINGVQVLDTQQSAISAPSGGGTVDAEARTAIGSILTALRNHGLIAT